MVWEAQRTFDHTDRAPYEARRFVGECLTAWGLTGVSERIVLAVSELTTNAVTHGSGPIEVALSASSDRLRVTVSDEGMGTPDMRFPAPGTGADGGWGLQLVDTLVDSWGTERRRLRLVVWFEHGLPPRP